MTLNSHSPSSVITSLVLRCEEDLEFPVMLMGAAGSSLLGEGGGEKLVIHVSKKLAASI